MKTFMRFGLVFSAIVLAACNGSLESDGSGSTSGSGGGNNVCSSGEVPKLTLMATGPADGAIPLGTDDAIFLNWRATATCGTVPLEAISFYIESEMPMPFCASPCSSDQTQWNFRNPRVTDGMTHMGTGTFKPMKTYDGTPAIITSAFGPLAVTSGEDNSFELRIDIAPAEVVAGSLIGHRFRALLGLADAPLASLQLDPALPIYGGYQTIVSQ
ncbi:MAG: hypothetical protein WA001_05985 [Patescibacteria group bacterium]